MKQKKIILFFVVLLCLISLIRPTYADVGDFETYSSGSYSGWSSSDYGSSWSSSDYGSSWSSSDYSRDYSRNYSSSGSEFDGNTIIALVITLVIIFIFISLQSKKYQNHGKNTITTNEKRKDEETILKEIKEIDPLFNKEEFNAWVRTLFIKLQYAWSDRNWEQMRYFETKELFEQHLSQLERYKLNKQINKLEGVSVNTVSYYNFEQIGDKDVLTVILNSKMIDYIIDEESGQIVKGDKYTYKINNYKLTFIRKTGVKTKAGEKKINVVNCPNCGAPIEMTSNGKCLYCRSVITTSEHDWVLSNLERHMN